MPFPYEENGLSADVIANRVDTVLFDYGMVLCAPPDPTAWAELLHLAGLDEDRLHEAYWHFRHDYDRGTLTGPAYWHAVAERTGITLSDSQVDTLLATDVDLWTVPNPPMVEWAARLQRAGVRTGILSNIGDSMSDGVVARLPWLSGFDHCTWSARLHLAKPELAIYIKTAEALRAAPAQILFIDDKEPNLVAAAEVGMHTILYSSQAAFEQEMRARGFAALLDVSAPEPAAK